MAEVTFRSQRKRYADNIRGPGADSESDHGTDEALQMNTLVVILTSVYTVVKIRCQVLFLQESHFVLFLAFPKAIYFLKRFYQACQLTINTSC